MAVQTHSYSLLRFVPSRTDVSLDRALKSVNTTPQEVSYHNLSMNNIVMRFMTIVCTLAPPKLLAPIEEISTMKASLDHHS